MRKLFFSTPVFDGFREIEPTALAVTTPAAVFGATFGSVITLSVSSSS